MDQFALGYQYMFSISVVFTQDIGTLGKAIDCRISNPTHQNGVSRSVGFLRERKFGIDAFMQDKTAVTQVRQKWSGCSVALNHAYAQIILETNHSFIHWVGLYY